MKKILALALLLLVTNQVYGNTSTEHIHGDRVHSHPLPNGNIGHSHRGVKDAGRYTKTVKNKPTQVSTKVSQSSADMFIGRSFRFRGSGKEADIYFVNDKVAITYTPNTDTNVFRDGSWEIVNNRLCISGFYFLHYSTASEERKNKKCGMVRIKNKNSITFRNPVYRFGYPNSPKYVYKEPKIEEGDYYNLLDGYIKYYDNIIEKFERRGDYKHVAKLKGWREKIVVLSKQSKNYEKSEHFKEENAKKYKSLALANQRKKHQLLQLESKKHFVLRAGFSPDKEPSFKSRTIPNLSSTFLLSPNLRQTTIIAPVLVAGQSIDGRSHKVQLKVSVEMKVGNGTTEVARDSKILNINLKPNTTARKDINLTLISTDLDVQVAKRLFGIGAKTPQEPTISYEVISWD